MSTTLFDHPAAPITRMEESVVRDRIVARHEPHLGNHIQYACGQKEPHCWHDREPWPCDTARLLATLDAERAEIEATLVELTESPLAGARYAFSVVRRRLDPTFVVTA